VQLLRRRYDVEDPASIVIVHDELDLPVGRMKVKEGGGLAGHNGLKSLIEVFGQGFPRLRIGIGRGHDDPDAIDRVLGEFSDSELRELPTIVDRAVAGVETWLTQGVTQAMNLVNAKP